MTTALRNVAIVPEPPSAGLVLQLRKASALLGRYGFGAGYNTGRGITRGDLCLPDGDCEGAILIRIVCALGIIPMEFPEVLTGTPPPSQMAPYFMMINSGLSEARANVLANAIAKANDELRHGLARRLARQVLWEGREMYRDGELAANHEGSFSSGGKRFIRQGPSHGANGQASCDAYEEALVLQR